MPRYENVSSILREFSRTMNSAVSSQIPASRTTHPGLPPVHPSANVNDLWGQACKAKSSGEYNNAAFLCKYIQARWPDHIQANQMLAELELKFAQAREIYEEIECLLASGSVIELMNMANAASRIYPDHPSRLKAISKLQPRFDGFCRAMEEALEALNRRDYFELLDRCLLAERFNPGDLGMPPLIDLIRERISMGSRR